ncbi:MAG TPA: hypothetical protein PLJ83_06320 [Spirochaetales bacterium]|nr:hypothetical protein [Spirochaetales bacterium]
MLHQELDTAKSTAKNPVYKNYTIIDAAFSYIAACLRDSMTPDWSYFSKANLLWQAVMKLPAAKRPQMPYADNLYAYLIAGNTELFKKTLAGLKGDTIQYIPFALITRQWDLVEILYKLNSIELDDPIKLGNYKEQSLLAWAITAGFPEEAILLLTKGAKVPEYVYYKTDDYTTGDAYPVIQVAAYGGDIALVETLIQKGASLADNQALFEVHTKPEIRKLLIESGMDPYIKFDSGNGSIKSILTDAALFGYEEAVAYYLSIQVPYEVADPTEVPPLFAAVVSANPKVVDMLIKAGADINQYVDCYGFEDFFFVYLDGSYTPLALAYLMRDRTDDQYKKVQYTKIIKMLEKLGAENKTSDSF